MAAGNNSAAEAWWSAAAECQREVADFVSLRSEKDTKVFRDALACKNPTDAVSIQSHWMEETLRDYQAGMARMFAIYTRNGADVGPNRQHKS